VLCVSSPEGLRPDRPVLTDKDEATLSKAFRSLRSDIIRQSAGEPTERQLIEAAIRLVVKVDRASAGDSPRLGNSIWPGYTRTTAERVDDAKQRQIDYDAGDLPEPVNVTPAEVTAAEVIQRVFQDCMTAKDRVRDWKLLFMLMSKNGDGKHPLERSGPARAQSMRPSSVITSPSPSAICLPVRNRCDAPSLSASGPSMATGLSAICRRSSLA
jgi:hypothetical protein